MAFGLGRLRLSPQSFWAMTPRELAAAMRVWRRDEARSIEQDALERLMRAFPDEGGEHE